MNLRIKATGFDLTSGLEELSREKLLRPLEVRLGKEMPSDAHLDIELAKTTRHHLGGKIWKCEINFAMPKDGKVINLSVFEESIDAAIDRAKDELEREINKYKGKREAQFMRVARRIKKDLHITRLARWFRKGRIRDEGV